MGIVPWIRRHQDGDTQHTEPQHQQNEAPQEGVNIHISAKPHPLLKDVLQAIGWDAVEVQFCADEPLKFTWQQGDDMSVQQNLLVTPSLNSLTNAEAKKSLWKLLQTL